MGKTYKDQRKYDKKHKDADSDLSKVPRKPKHRPYEEMIPEDDPLDQYEQLDYDYDDKH